MLYKNKNGLNAFWDDYPKICIRKINRELCRLFLSLNFCQVILSWENLPIFKRKLTLRLYFSCFISIIIKSSSLVEMMIWWYVRLKLTWIERLLFLFIIIYVIYVRSRNLIFLHEIFSVSKILHRWYYAKTIIAKIDALKVCKKSCQWKVRNPYILKNTFNFCL